MGSAIYAGHLPQMLVGIAWASPKHKLYMELGEAAPLLPAPLLDSQLAFPPENG